MFDGEDALGQTQTMALDNQRNLALALARDGLFLRAAEGVAADMNRWSRGFFGRDIVRDWREQLDCTSTTATSETRTAPASRRPSWTPVCSW
jgi:malate synthase